MNKSDLVTALMEASTADALEAIFDYCAMRLQGAEVMDIDSFMQQFRRGVEQTMDIQETQARMH